MSTPFRLASLLLVSSALVAPSVAVAQNAPAANPEPQAMPVATEEAPAAADAATPVEEEAAEAPVDVSIPGGGGGDIVVTGRRSTSNIAKSAPQVVSILSSVDIARTGEGDIAGALSRVTGLSVVGNGFVFVRGLGDRYSLALLNGSPLSSPEPLKRVVPLDLFPTNIIASSLVQKSYSVNFPGEFGGGVINLTTKAIPEEPFLSISTSVQADSEATNKLGYTYYGSSIDWSGFTNANRDLPPALTSFLASGKRMSEGTVDTQEIAGEIFNARNSLVQRVPRLAPNFSLGVSGGRSWDVGDDTTLGLIASAAYSNKWRSRDTLQQTTSTEDLSQKDIDFRRVITDNRIVLNGLVGLGLEFGDNKIRWTNLYIRDTLKQARLGQGTRQSTSPTATFLQQNTAWYERQLIDSHAVAELKLTPELSMDIRAGYANAQREAPFENSFEYSRSNEASDPYGALFVNRLNNGQAGSAQTVFSTLNEDLWSASTDLTYRFMPELRATIGYAFSDTKRRTERREFLVVAPGTMPIGVGLLRPDLLLSKNVIDSFNIALIDSNEGNPVFNATLRNHAGYLQIQAELTPELSLNTGVRFEKADQSVTPVQVFTTPTASLAGTNLNREYWLPAMTLTYQVNPEMQLRLNGSKTIARPQFRELIFQRYFDPDANRLFNGNPLLKDSQLYNAEARYEWYFARDQRVSAAAFYKKIKNPIETYSGLSESTLTSSFANAPQATLLGAEFELQKYFPLDGLGDASFLASRRLAVIANYTYTTSKVSVKETDTVAAFALSSTRALDFFRDGSALTGQSDHLVNLQLGIEDQDRLSQQTLLVTYASDRVTSRSVGGLPDIIERPGLRLDFVAREGFKVFGREGELSFEARNLLRVQYKEFQQNGDNIIFYNKYRMGTTFELGLTFKF